MVRKNSRKYNKVTKINRGNFTLSLRRVRRSEAVGANPSEETSSSEEGKVDNSIEGSVDISVGNDVSEREGEDALMEMLTQRKSLSQECQEKDLWRDQ